MGWMTRIFSTGDEGHGRKLNAYNVYMLLFVSLGSMVYGYTASIIGSTLGMCLLRSHLPTELTI